MATRTTPTILDSGAAIQNRKSKIENREGLSRREFLGAAALVGTGALLGLRSESMAAEPPPEISKIRLLRGIAICQAPQHAAEDLLRAEGFSDVQEIRIGGPDVTARISALGAGHGDILSTYVGPFLERLDAGDSIVILSGLHVGCLELFGTDRIRTIRDLKGKTVAVTSSAAQFFLASVVSYVGLNPRKEINWVTHPSAEAIRFLAESKIDAHMAIPPDPYELRTKKIGRVLVSSSTDRPWSQYFCCMVAANREFVRKNPVATKRALRAILKATNICALEPERIARFLVDKGYAKNYDSALGTLKEIPYTTWREYDPEDTIRFYALRLNEVGMIKSSPQKIIAQGTDWRFISELKKELKG
jgi:NitT/TauT family transport system substrate-binding protein